MKKNDSFGFDNTVYIWKNDELLVTKNLVVDDGLEEVAKAIAQETTAMPEYIAVGTDGTSESNTDTSLGSEVARESASVSRSGTIVTLEGSLTNISAGVEEAGLFSASTGGTMFARTTFNVINLDSNDELTVIWTITASS